MKHKTDDFSHTISNVLKYAIIITFIFYIFSCLAIWIALSIHGYGHAFSEVHDQFSWRIVTIATCITALILIIQYFLQPHKRLRTIILCSIGGIPCIILAFFFGKDIITDIPYITNPKITFFNHLSFRLDYSDESGPSHTMEGYTIEGGHKTLYLDEETYETGHTYNQSNEDAMARVVYLPSCNAIYDISFVDSIGEELNTLFPASTDLPATWESFSVELNNTVYSLPLPLRDFLDNGWTYEGNDDASIPSNTSHNIKLTNAKDFAISATACNNTTETIPLEEGIVTELSITIDHLDFDATQCRLPGGFILNWSTASEVLDVYEGADRSYSEILRFSQGEDKEFILYVHDGLVNRVTIRNHPDEKDNAHA